MTIETLTKQSRPSTGLAGIDSTRLKKMHNTSLRASFNRMEDTRHRMEFVARILDREYINDAAARTVNATWYTLESTQGGLVWIACGTDKPTDYSRLLPAALRKVRLLLVVGPDKQLCDAFTGHVPSIVSCTSMAEALHRAYLHESSDVKVVFSPACDDGTPTAALADAFRREVNEL